MHCTFGGRPAAGAAMASAIDSGAGSEGKPAALSGGGTSVELDIGFGLEFDTAPADTVATVAENATSAGTGDSSDSTASGSEEFLQVIVLFCEPPLFGTIKHHLEWCSGTCFVVTAGDAVCFL